LGTITIIAAFGTNRVIGNENDIPWRLPAEQQRFKQLTMGHTLIMGRKTYDSIGRPLPGRTTIVVTRQPDWTADGVTMTHSLEDALAAAASEQIFIAGGGQIRSTSRHCLLLIGSKSHGSTNGLSVMCSSQRSAQPTGAKLLASHVRLHILHLRTVASAEP
jgi:hypothetical protein